MIKRTDELEKRLPELKIIAFEFEIQVDDTPPSILYAMNERFKLLKQMVRIEELSKLQTIKWGRSGYRKLGKDPTKYRLSSEKLLRRVLKGGPFPSINNVVDVMNWLSIELQSPIGVYDREAIVGDIFLDYGRQGEFYTCLAGYDLNLEGLPIVRDSQGPFGSSTSDSCRTSLKERSNRILICVYNFNPQDSEEEIRRMATAFIKKIQ